jgi:hypothetical protein
MKQRRRGVVGGDRMKIEDLKQIKHELKVKEIEYKQAKAAYLFEHGVHPGTTVMLTRGNKKNVRGIVRSAEISDIDFGIRYIIAKMKKDGAMHATANIGWYKVREDFEVVRF